FYGWLTFVLVARFFIACRYLSFFHITNLHPLFQLLQPNPFLLSITSPPHSGHVPSTSIAWGVDDNSLMTTSLSPLMVLTDSLVNPKIACSNSCFFTFP